MANASERTILFLIADTGAGHRSAANAIRNAITLISQKEQEEWHAHQQNSSVDQITVAVAPPTYRIEIVDVFEEYSRFPLREAVKLYGPAIRYNPKMYGRVFHLSNVERRMLTVQSLATPLIHNGLIRLISTVRPDIIVSIHPMLNHVTIDALRDMGMHIPFITVVTDLISVHYAWFAPGADGYIVPTEQAKEIYLARGLDAERVHLLGMPIDPKFTRPLGSKQEIREKLGLDLSLPVVLLAGGGEGSGGLQESVRAISRARLPVQILVVTGRNRRLYAHLQRTRSSLRVPARIFGFVQNMPELMRAADVIVTKAGPGTICEALACELPIVLSGYVPGQEEGNVDFVLKNDVGFLAHDALELVDGLRRMIKPGSATMRRQSENAKRLSRPYASFDIAACILSFLPEVSQQSVWQNRQIHKRRLLAMRPLRTPQTRLRALRRRLPRMTQMTFLKSPLSSHLRLRRQRTSNRFTLFERNNRDRHLF
jgi:1,2-diacylglycerol 3-beta-galactosyltransferase